jgi:signal peptidase I
VDDDIGKAALIVWPLNRFGIVHAPDIQDTAAAALPAAGTAPHAVGVAGALPNAARRHSRRY